MSKTLICTMLKCKVKNMLFLLMDFLFLLFPGQLVRQMRLFPHQTSVSDRDFISVGGQNFEEKMTQPKIGNFVVIVNTALAIVHYKSAEKEFTADGSEGKTENR